MTTPSQALIDYFRCLDKHVSIEIEGPLSTDEGYFRFGSETVFGQTSRGTRASRADAQLYNALTDDIVGEGRVRVPFNPTDVVDNLRLERYASHEDRHGGLVALAKAAYYRLRPFMPTRLRRAVQRFYFRDWEEMAFPAWPVDTSVENLCEEILILSMKAQNLKRIPFIWFWPGEASSCAIMTHDVETALGRDFCGTLMDIDDRFGIKASFQVVPEERYEVPTTFLDGIRARGFEIVIHDLNHDGYLFRDHDTFVTRAAKINVYGKQFGAEGFRSAVLYRNQSWLNELRFSYDMSIPNVAHLDPQRGGCCTVMPYFIGDILELPVTTTQDYSLFQMMHDYSLDLWKWQTELIVKKHGLISFIVHPDYVTSEKERAAYEGLLGHLSELREWRGVWIAKPGEVAEWWRDRAAMRLVEGSDGIRIEGQGSERARIAYATEEDGRLTYAIEPDRKGALI